MKRALLITALLNSVLLALLLPVELRAKLSRPVAAMLGKMRARMPDE